MHSLFKRLIAGLLGMLFITTAVIAATPPITPQMLPSSVQPTVIGRSVMEQTPAPPKKNLTPIVAPKSPALALGPQAEQVKFNLTHIILVGNHVYTTAQLSVLYQKKLGKKITVAQLIEIVQQITNHYRNNGYIISRAVLPSQHIKNGVVQIRILEGFIDKATVIGTPRRSKAIIEKYVANIVRSRPLKINVLEQYLRLINEVPGVHARAVLEPSKATLAASSLNVVSDIDRFTSYVTYDNYGSRYIGPNQVTVNGTLNSVLLSGDTARVTYVSTTRPKNLQYIDGYYGLPIGKKGLRFSFDANESQTRPGLNLAPLKIEGKSNSYTGTLEYPILLSRATDFKINGQFHYVDSGTNAFGDTLYIDHLRFVSLGVVYSHADTLRGINNFNGNINQGLNILGATHQADLVTTSRFGAVGTFTKFDFTANRTQQLWSRFSAYFQMAGQYSFNPLFSSEQFSFGGSILGRGYDTADIIGDSGVGGSVELRMDVTPGWRLLQYCQPYIFYDAGMVFNRKNLQDTLKQSETSTGVGLRFLFTKNISANFMLAQPLTKQDSTEATVGNGRRPRGLFSLVLTT